MQSVPRLQADISEVKPISFPTPQMCFISLWRMRLIQSLGSNRDLDMRAIPPSHINTKTIIRGMGNKARTEPAGLSRPAHLII